MNPNDHLANERTFLAWIRTSICIMAFGFVVEKFSIFLKEISHILTPAGSHTANLSSVIPNAYSSYLGISLVTLGLVICLLAFVKFKKTESQIKRNSYRPAWLLDTMLALSVILIGILLITFLVHNLI